MKNKVEKSKKKINKNKIVLYSSIFALSLLSLTAVTSCSSVTANSSNTSSINQSINTYDGNKGFASGNNFSLKNVAIDSLKSSTGSKAFLTYKSNQLIYNWFENSSDQSVKQLFQDAQKKAETQYNSQVTSYQKQYGSNWQYYIQNNLLDPVGGTKALYIQNQMYSTLQTDFQNYIFGTNINGFKNLLGFEQITNKNQLLDFNKWTQNDLSVTQDFINNPINWAGNNNPSDLNKNFSLGFFPSNSLSLNSTQQNLYLHLSNFDQYLFDQWIINENPFICSSILYEYYTKNNGNNLTSSNAIYNSSYFQNLPSSNNLAFPQFGTKANNQFDNHLYKYLQPESSSNPDGYIKLSNGTYLNPIIDNWNVQSDNNAIENLYNTNAETGGFNFLNLGNVGNTQTGYFVTNGANLQQSSSTYAAYSSYLSSYSAAAISRYNALMYDENNTSTSINGVGGSLYNIFSSTSLNQKLLANFLYVDGTNNGEDSGTFTPSYLSTPSSNSISVTNPRYTYLLYNGVPLNNASLSEFWNLNNGPNLFSHDTMTILSFNVTYNSQLSPFIFTRDGDGVHVLAIDGYNRILYAEQNPSAMSSPINVYPNPTNAYEAAIDAIAQDILWRQTQLDYNIQTNYKINLFSALETYFKNNEASLLLGYASQILNNTNNKNYNALFSNQYNLFSQNDVSNIFNTSNTNLQKATLNLINSLVLMHNYITEQNNENVLKNQILVSYTSNGTSSNSGSSSSSYGIGSNFDNNGIKPAFPYFIDLSSSLIYPFLSYYVYHLSFANTLYSNDANNYAASLYDNGISTSSYSSLLNLDEQLSNLNTNLNNSINTYIDAINLQPWSTSASEYSKYAQYVFTNNNAINNAINAINTNNTLGDLVKNNILANSMKIKMNALPSVSNNFNLTTSNLNNIFSGTDTNYGNLSYLTTALIYEDFLSDFSSNAALSVNYGYNYNLNQNYNLPTQTEYNADLANITNTIANYYIDKNYIYSLNGLNNDNSFNNSYLTLLQTINFLYDNGTWNNLWNYFNTILNNGPAYVVWVNGDNASFINNMNNTTSSTLSNTGSSQQYANNLNSTLNNNYNKLKTNYGVSGYTLPSNLSSFGYSAFNFIPNANLNGQMLNVFMDQQLANTASSYSLANLSFNNITSYIYQLNNYFNLANVKINGTSGEVVPFTGFIGLQTYLNHSALTNLQLANYLFNNANYSINGYGLLANYYGGIGLEPTSNNLTKEPAGSLMSAILNADSLANLINISQQLQNISTTIPQFSKQYYENESSQEGVNLNYAKAIYKSITSIPSYQNYFKNFSGFVTGFASAPTAPSFNNLNDFYDVITGGNDLTYNNLYNSWDSYQNLLTSKTQAKTANLNLINSWALDRLIPQGSGNYITLSNPVGDTQSSNYKFLMYADQISKSSIGNSAWNTNTPWIKLGLTEDAFAKLVVQIAQNTNEQSAAISAFTMNNNNKVDVYDIRFKNALGILWVLNWIIN